MKFQVYNSFTEKPFAGNPAGVVMDFDKDLSDQNMQNIAKQLNLVETIFVHRSDEYDFEFRYFTPHKELPMAGHPTLAALCALRDSEVILKSAASDVVIETKGGLIRSYVEDDKVYLSQKSPEFFEVNQSHKDKISEVFKVDTNEISDLPIASVNAGLGHFIFATKTLEGLMSLSFDVDTLRSFCKDVKASEAQIFCLETYEAENDLHTRNLCPRLGMEDPACGNGTAALMGYFARYISPEKETIEMRTEHGFCVDRPSIIEGKSIKPSSDQIDVWVGGKAVLMLEGHFNGF